MRAIYLPLPSDVEAAVFKLASAELRHPKSQAVVLLCEALRARGLLAPEPPVGAVASTTSAGARERRAQ